MAKFKISPALLIALLIAAFFAISLLLRIYIPHDQIIVGDDIKYSSNDAYFYMRLVDNVDAHFPHLTQFDPYFIYPGGNNVVSLPFFHWLIAVFAWIIGLGHPSQNIIDLVGVYLPAIMGALTIIPVFFIGKALFNKWAGVLAAGLAAILPGEFISRSVLGAADNPVAEVLFTAAALAFLIWAIKTASQNHLTFNHVLKRDWKAILKPLIFSVLAGLFLGFYLTTWQGALLFVFLIALYLIIQTIIDHLHGKSSEYLCIVGFVTFLLALIVLLLNPFTTDITIALVFAVLLPLVLYGLSRFMSARGLKPFYYPLTLVGLVVIAALILYFAAPGIYGTLLAKFKFVFFPVGSTARTTIEMAPTLIPEWSGFTPLIGWGNFPVSFFIAPWWLIFGLGAAAVCGYLFHLIAREAKKGLALLVFFGVSLIIMAVLTANKLPIQYLMTADEVKFIPGLAFISLSILFYMFIKQGKEQPWYIGLAWVVAILIALSLLMIFTTYSDMRLVALIPLALLVYILFKGSEGNESLRLFILWSLLILLILLVQRRFQYYFAVNVAVLSGYLCWEVIRLSGVNELAGKSEEKSPKELSFAAAPQKRDHYETLGINKNASYKEVKSAFRKLTAGYQPGPQNTPEAEQKNKDITKAYQTLTNPSLRAGYDSSMRNIPVKREARSQKGGRSRWIYFVNISLAIVLVFLFLYCPTLSKAQGQASQVTFAISDAWQDAMHWLANNTPEPMGDPEAYYKDYDAVPPGESFQYPASAYGVLAWWDYGYWITRIAHRIPNANPSQSPDPIRNVANFFLSQNLTAAENIRKELGAEYFVVDFDMITGKYPAVIDWAGQDAGNYMDTFLLPQPDGSYYGTTFYYPAYYRSMLVRLYNFDGQAVTSENATVLTFEAVKDPQGNPYKVVTDTKEFSSYKEAVDFAQAQGLSNHAVVSPNPYVSCVKLDAMTGYTRRYGSAQMKENQSVVFMPTPALRTDFQPEVKIFEFTANN